jgi:VanZ family protein
MSDDAAGVAPAQHRLRRALPWLLVYAVALVLIAFWPEHVDKGAGAFLKRVTDLFPILTYRRIEFGANILLFVPLGILLAILLSQRRYLIMPAGFLISLTIESGQGIFLADRTASVSDLISNTAGACLGLLAVEIAEALRRRRGAPGR